MALTFQVPKLRHAKVEIVILTRSAMFPAQIAIVRRTHTHACYVGPDFVQERHHMSALCDSAFETWVECIAGEEGQNVGLTSKSWVAAVVVHEGLEARGPANRLCRARSMR